jgi:cell division protein FtsB
MQAQLKQILDKQLKNLSDIRNVALYVFVIVLLAIAWSSAKTIQKNYDLQKQISTLKQQNQVIQIHNENIRLENKYYQTDQYLELTARQVLGLAAPGEKVLLIPKSVALKNIDPSRSKQVEPKTGNPIDNRSTYIKNMETWRDFLLGRNLSE